MKIDVTKIGDNNFTVEIFLDGSGDASYSETGVPFSQLGALDVQSHWGSGVIFSNMTVTKKQP